jgi:hypothetical protein
MDKIDELFTQAGGYIEIDKDGNRWTYSQECDPDTFAELIIRECSELTLDYKNKDYYSGWLDYREEIKKHFWSK